MNTQTKTSPLTSGPPKACFKHSQAGHWLQRACPIHGHCLTSAIVVGGKGHWKSDCVQQTASFWKSTSELELSEFSGIYYWLMGAQEWSPYHCHPQWTQVTLSIIYKRTGHVYWIAGGWGLNYSVWPEFVGSLKESLFYNGSRKHSYKTQIDYSLVIYHTVYVGIPFPVHYCSFQAVQPLSWDMTF